MKPKFIYLIVGKSGSGKTTIVDKMRWLGNSIQSYTTRPRRTENETGHVFVNQEKFDNLNLVSYTHFNGYDYGATQEQIESSLFYVVDPAGVRYFQEHYRGDKPYRVVYVKSSAWDRFSRMCKRDGVIKAAVRIIHDVKAFAGFEKSADFVVVNDDINVAEHRLLKYIRETEFDL